MADGETKELTEDEKAAAEWEAMMAADEAKKGGGDPDADAAAWEAAMNSGSSAQPSRVLSQDEIDSLLGFGGGDSGAPKTGIQLLLDKSLNTFDKLPMIEVVFDRLVRMMSTSLRNFTSANVDVSIHSISSQRFGDYLNSIPLPALIVIFKALEWDNYGLVTVDSSLIYSVVDVLLGGRRTNRPIRVEGRPYTTIEQNLIRGMVEIALADMSAAFDPISPVTFSIDRLETNPRFATIARPANAAILIRLRIDMDDRGGNMEILLPHATLEPIRDLLLQMFMGEKFGRDSIWETHLGKELNNTVIEIDALISEEEMTLGDVMKFKVGTTILLDKRPNDLVSIRCSGLPLLTATVGRISDKIAVKVEDKIKKQQVEE